MLLPNHRAAIIQLEKLTDYCLNPEHPRGKHKARVFESVLGFTIADANNLVLAIREGIANYPCIPSQTDDFGRRFIVDFPCQHNHRSAFIRTSWILLHQESAP